MKNVAIINNGDRGSTGNIAKNLHRDLKNKGFNSYLCYGRGEYSNSDDAYKTDSDWELKCHAMMTRISGRQGFYSKRATSRLLAKFDEWKIDTVFIVCIHGYYINETKLYEYIANHNIRLVHIMIDEYAYTGKCAYCDGCERYRVGCGKCPHKKDYPSSILLDGSKAVFNAKRQSYSRLKNAIFVGPQFVVEQAHKSPLFMNLKTEILDEAVDMEVFCPREVGNLRKSLGIDPNKIIIVSVVPYDGGDNDRKGGRYFIELAKLLERDDRFVFVHVGYKCKNAEQLPSNFIPVGFINDLNLLAEYFSLGDMFVFPSLLDTMPNACLDALSCGTPLLCFKISGMPYVANDEVGTFVEARNVEALATVVKSTQKKTQQVIDNCRTYAMTRYNSKDYNEKLISIANKSFN